MSSGTRAELRMAAGHRLVVCGVTQDPGWYLPWLFGYADYWLFITAHSYELDGKIDRALRMLASAHTVAVCKALEANRDQT